MDPGRALERNPFAEHFRILANPAISGFFKSDESQEFCNPRVEWPALKAAKSPVEPQGFFRSEKLIKTGGFRQEADAAMAAVITAVDAEDPRLSVGGADQAQEDFQSGGLARSVWAKQSIDFRPPGSEAEIVYRDHLLPAKRHG